MDLALTQPCITTMTEYIQQYNDHPGPDIATTEKVTTSYLKDVDTNHRIRAARFDHHKRRRITPYTKGVNGPNLLGESVKHSLGFTTLVRSLHWTCTISGVGEIAKVIVGIKQLQR